MAPRKPSAERLEELLEAATVVFASRGFRRARMDEIADRAGVSPGNLYRYVTGKQALFRLVMERSIDGPALTTPAGPFPIDGPPPAETVRWVGTRLDFSDFPLMAAALARKRTTRPARELAEIVEELFVVVRRTRDAARILERSAPEMPDVAAMFFGVRRELFDRMARYIELRIRGRAFLPVVEPAATARLLVEATVWAANDRLDDPDPESVIPDDQAREALVELALRVLVGPERSSK